MGAACMDGGDVSAVHGIDPLGLATASPDRNLPELSTGISVLTRHLRYWSFYTWLLTEGDDGVRRRCYLGPGTRTTLGPPDGLPRPALPAWPRNYGSDRG